MLLIYCPLPEGGIAEHTHYQACAAVRAGADVRVLVSSAYLDDGRTMPYGVIPALWAPSVPWRFRTAAKAYFGLAIIVNQLLLAGYILRHRVNKVLFAASSETLALIWAWPHIVLRRLGVRYAVNIHDPKRAQSGRSARLHRLAVATSFKPFEIGLVHEDFDAVRPDVPAHIRCVSVPYGCYDGEQTGADGATLRASVAPPGACRRVFLAFGYIGDRKNLDVFIRAMPECRDVALIVAGQRASRRDRPPSYYLELAQELGVAERVRIDEGFIPDRATRHYFDACDVVLLSYASGFVSQSGVLLAAANWGKPVLASSGPGPLSTVVRRFGFGVAVEPDSVEEIKRGIALLAEQRFDPDSWARFRRHASWDRNMAALFGAFGAPHP